MRGIVCTAIIAAAVATPAIGIGAPRPAVRTNLSVYAGKYSFDVVRGYRFFDHPAVKAAIARAVRNPRQRAAIHSPEDGAVSVPIVRVRDGRILAWGGAKRAEDSSNWAVVIAPDGSKPEICLYEGVGADDDTPSSQWFVPGQPGIMKIGRCPSAAEDYPPHEIAAG